MQTVQDNQDLSSILDQAHRTGGVRIRRSDGQTFVLTPEQADSSPFDVEGIDLQLSAVEIIEYIHEGRKGL